MTQTVPRSMEMPGLDADTLHRLGAFVPRLHLHWMEHEPSQRWRVVDGSLLYSDVSGFTAMSERLSRLGKRGAEETNELINGLMGGMVDDCAAEGGEVLVFAGDAVIALFEGEGHTARATRAAHAIRKTVTRRHTTASGVTAMLRVSSGVHSGDILLARITPSCEKLVLLGPAVTAMCQAEAAATAGEILLTQQAAAHLDPRLLDEADERGRLLRRRPPGVVGAAEMLRDASDRFALRGVPADMHDLLGVVRTGEHRQVTVAFVEFSGVDELLAANGPDVVVDALDALSTTVANETTAYSVHVIDTDIAPNGGKYYLVAGAPTSTEFDEENLLRATLGILGHAGPLRLRAGVNRGRVFSGAIGGPTRRAYTCLGDAVNLGARLCAHADRGSALVNHDVLSYVRATTDAQRLPPITVKGKTDLIETAAVRSIGPRYTDAEAHTTSSVSGPLVGRRAELDRLVLLARRAAEGHGATVVITGEAGMGKSRLLDELVDQSGLPYQWSEAEPYQVNTPYSAVCRVLRPLLGIAGDADDLQVEARLRELGARAIGVRGLLPLAALAVGSTMPSTPQVADISPAFLGATLHRVVLALLDATEPVPLLIIADDTHWADEASLEMLAVLAAYAARRPWLLCLGTRDDWQPPGSEQMPLSVLPDDDAAELTRALLGESISARDRRSLEERGEGNPLFLHELARAARATGSVADLPDSIESLLMARIDMLAASDRVLLREASVLGTRIDVAFLARVLHNPQIEQAEPWQRLATFVEPDDPGVFRFIHALGQEAAYEGLSYSRRRAVHARIGEELEAEPDSIDRHAAIMALHFAAAGEHDRGWRYGVVAGDRAMAAFANADAAASYERALHEATFLTGLEALTIATVEERYGDVCDMAGRYEEAGEAYRRARRRWPTARLLRKIGFIHERVGAYDKAYSAQRRALNELRRATEAVDIAERALVHAFCAGLHHRQGHLHAALEFGIKAAVDAQAAANPQVLARATLLLELVTSQLGFVGKSVELFHAAGDLNGEADARNNRGMAAYYRGDWANALNEYEASSALFARTGDVVGAATALNNIGEILSDQGRVEEAMSRFEPSERAFREANYPVGVALVISNTARAAARAGDDIRALELLDDARRRFSNLDAGGFMLDERCRRLECLLIAGRLDEAVIAERELAESAAAAVHDAHVQATVHRLRGWLALTQDRLEDAATELAASREEAAIADARFELALTLLVVGSLEERRTGEPSPTTTEAWAMLDQLDVVEVAGWPRPAPPAS